MHADRNRTCRPRVYAAAVVAEVKAMACEPPEELGVPHSRWSAAHLAARAAEEGLVVRVSCSTVHRWPDQDAIRPWRYRSWMVSCDLGLAQPEPGIFRHASQFSAQSRRAG